VQPVRAPASHWILPRPISRARGRLGTKVGERTKRRHQNTQRTRA
jgi:hypothetical protein